MNILVLGSDGQIGKPLVNSLESKGYNVTKFDIFSNKLNDLRIQGVLDGLLPESDFVYFLAFDIGGSRYLKEHQNTFDFIDNNFKIMSNTFNSIRKHNKKFIFSSSQMSNMLFSSYGMLKRVGEFYTNSIDGINVKFWNIYGVEHDLDKSHVITDFIKMAKYDGTIKIIGDGLEERQFLFVDDCCECLIMIMENYNQFNIGKPIDISSFEWSSILDVANVVSSEFNNCDIKTTESDNYIIQSNYRNEPDRFILDYWKPKTSLKDGIKLIIKEI